MNGPGDAERRPGDDSGATIQAAGRPEATVPEGTDIATEARGNTPHPFTQLLDALQHPGPVALCARNAAGAFVSLYVGTVPEAVQLAQALPGRDVWFGINPVADTVKPPQRGTAGQVTALIGVWADLDVKPGAMRTLNDANRVIAVLSDMLGVRPSAVVMSGHGLQPYWTFSEPLLIVDDQSRDATSALLTRWGRLVGHIADLTCEGGVDNVFDLARVLRVPGTTNCKHDPVPTVLEYCSGNVLDPDQLDKVLDQYNIPTEPPAATTGDPVTHRSSWEYTGRSCAYAAAMVKGWAGDNPTGRHQWLLSQHTRVALAHRVGCWSESGHRAALVELRKQFDRLLSRPGDLRMIGRGEWSDAAAFGVDKAEKTVDPWADPGPGKARELGEKHRHVIDGDHTEDPARQGDTQPDPTSLAQAHAVFRRWLGDTYDVDALNFSLAVIAVEQLDGDPLWGLLVSGSGNAKTETVMACADRAVMTSTITSVGALLSGTSAKEKAKDSSGGLLRKLEPRGVMVIKDVTSILSMDRNLRGEVLGALREVHDGAWDRNVGTDGGRTLHWAGRIAVLGAVTTAWDTAHSVIATMGDRFALLRMDSTINRPEAGRRAIGNTGDETTMRTDLRRAAAGVIAGMTTVAGKVSNDEMEALLTAADLVTRARTGVEYDYQGRVIDAHAPEMPTRFAKELAQVLRGGVAIGMERADAFRLAIRVARDSMPPLRLLIIDDLAEQPGSTPADVRKRIGKPWSTVDRQLQALHMLGVVDVVEEGSERFGKAVTRWRYSLAEWVDPACLNQEHVTRKVRNPPAPHERERETESDTEALYTPSNFPGDVEPPPPLALVGDLRSLVEEPCLGCGQPMAEDLYGDRRHPNCREVSA